MTQPDYVPLTVPVRPFWTQPSLEPTLKRPAELHGQRLPKGRLLGSPGPDQGYALSLVDRFVVSDLLDDDEHLNDVKAAVMALATKRASLYRRAPSVVDINVVLAIFSFGDPDAKDEVRALRKTLLGGLAHSYIRVRELCDLVPEEILRASVSQIRSSKGLWDEWIRESDDLGYDPVDLVES